MLTADQIVNGYIRGTEIALDRHPCSICEGGIKFEEFPHFHGSDFSYCLRKIQLRRGDFIKPEQNWVPRCRKVFLYDGHLHEHGICEALRTSGLKITHRDGADEFGAVLDPFKRNIHLCTSFGDMQDLMKVIKDPLAVMGHTDGVINDRYLLECKALRDTRFELLALGKGDTQKLMYSRQMVCYMECLDLEYGFMFVKSRHGHDTPPLVFKVPRDPEFFWRRAEDLARVQSLILGNQRLTDKGYSTQTNYECRYCDWRQECW